MDVWKGEEAFDKEKIVAPWDLGPFHGAASHEGGKD